MADGTPPQVPLRRTAEPAPEGTGASWAEQARRVEDLGYSTLLMPDHFGDQLAPVPALTAAADATTTLRMGSLVFDNDYRHPLVLAKEAATLDVLSGGRFELSLGAGWMRTDYEQAGIAYDPPAVRVDRFEEAVTGGPGAALAPTVPTRSTASTTRSPSTRSSPRPVQRPHPPLIIGGGGSGCCPSPPGRPTWSGINVNLREGTGGAETAPDATPDLDPDARSDG